MNSSTRTPEEANVLGAPSHASLSRFVCFLLAILFMVAAPHRCATANTLTVAPDGASPFPSIQAAVDAASPGDTLSLLDGVFTGPGNQDISFKGKPLVVCSAGGDPSRCMIDCQSTSRGFTFESGETRQAVIANICILRGFASQGAGIFCAKGASPTVLGCIFELGHASDSGGGAFLSESDAAFIDCRFTNNTAHHSGGGIAVQHCSTAELLHCTFVGNAAPMGSGISCVGLSTLLLSRSLLAFGIGSSAIGGTNRPGSCNLDIACTNMYGHVGGNWVDCAAPFEGVHGNIALDPRFRARMDGDYSLLSNSPCLARNSPCGERIGCRTDIILHIK